MALRINFVIWVYTYITDFVQSAITGGARGILGELAIRGIDEARFIQMFVEAGEMTIGYEYYKAEENDLRARIFDKEDSLYQLHSDEVARQCAQSRADAAYWEAIKNNKLHALEETNAQLQSANTELQSTNTNQAVTIAQQSLKIDFQSARSCIVA